MTSSENSKPNVTGSAPAEPSPSAPTRPSHKERADAMLQHALANLRKASEEADREDPDGKFR